MPLRKEKQTVKIKALNIRDFFNSPRHRQAMGYFKYIAYEMGITQAELLVLVQTRSLDQIKREIDFKSGNCMEIDLKGEQNGK